MFFSTSSLPPREETSNWYRFQMRQALWFGNLTVAIALVAFTWPLIVSFFATDATLVILVYVFAMLVDTAIFVTWLILAVRYSRRAAHGDLFDIPWVVRITGTRSQKP